LTVLGVLAVLAGTPARSRCATRQKPRHTMVYRGLQPADKPCFSKKCIPVKPGLESENGCTSRMRGAGAAWSLPAGGKKIKTLCLHTSDPRHTMVYRGLNIPCGEAALTHPACS